jgi:two-component system, LuxR family, response regulator FixJ
MDDELVFIVDDDSDLRDSLAALLEVEGYRVVSYGSAAEFLSEPVTDNGCLILDLKMPGMSGIELQRHIAESGRVLPVILVSAFAEVGSAVASMKLGAFDVIEKPFDDKHLLEVVAAALVSGRKRRQEIATRRDATQRLSGLSPREWQVLARVAEGASSKVIAENLGISRRTVEIHRAKIMRKAEVQNTAELVRLTKDANVDLANK